MHPDEVTWITDEVAITNFFSAHSREILADHEIKAILCLDRALQGGAAIERGIDCVRTVHLEDGANPPSVFHEAVESLAQLVNDHRRVLVHCRAGRSRSVAIVAAYLVRANGLRAADALEHVRARRDTAIAPELVRLVEEFDPSV
jgi:atypical dual specificity phosphatase